MTNSFLFAWNAIQQGYAYAEHQGIGFYRFPAFQERSAIDHGFTARFGGVSTGGLSTLNLSFSRPEPRKHVLENYRRFCLGAQIPYESMVMDNYEHGTTVLVVNRADCGRGYLKEALPACDGLATNQKGVTLITGHADCMAFYFYDPVRQCIGLAHAGWKGALGRIGINVINTMRKSFFSDPKDMIAGIGPCICQNCFEVDESLGETFRQAFPKIPCVAPGKPGKAQVNLPMIGVYQFIEAGILPEHITWMNVCTAEDDRLFSHRRDHGDTGGMAAYLRLL